MKKVEKDTDRDHYMDAGEAVEYGLVDEIIHPAENAVVVKAGLRPPTITRTDA